MLDLPAPILNVFAFFSPLFSRSIFYRLCSLLQAHILCNGRRTITQLLRTLGLSHANNYSKFHWVFSNAKWSAFKASKILFLRIVSLLSDEEEVVIPIDTTIERRKGPKIKSLGRQRDAVRSTKSRKVLTIGLQWLVASVSLKIPYCSRCWALPFFTQLIPPKRPLSTSKNRADLKENKRHKKLTVWAAQLPSIIRKWLGKRKKFVIVADQAFACYKIAHACIKAGGALVSRLRMDARIFDFPSPTPFRLGRPRLVGKRQPLFSELLKDTVLHWEEIEVSWYGGKKKRLFVYQRTSLWYAYGIPPVTIRWVLVKDPQDELDPIVLFSTNIEHSAARIIEIFVLRWQLEVTFEESRRHLGIETQRQWADKAIERTTPCLYASFSLITLMAVGLARENQGKIPIQKTAWYRKDHVTFSDALALVKTCILKRKYLSKFAKKGELGKRELEDLIYQAAAA